jgi:PAS domain S-box-containing protein
MESELTRIVDALPGMVWTSLPNGDVDFVNQRWCEFTGLTPDQAYGAGWVAAIHPDDLPGLVDGLTSVLRSGEPRELETRMRRADGAYRWFVFHERPVLDASGEILKSILRSQAKHRGAAVEQRRFALRLTRAPVRVRNWQRQTCRTPDVGQMQDGKSSSPCSSGPNP